MSTGNLPDIFLDIRSGIVARPSGINLGNLTGISPEIIAEIASRIPPEIPPGVLPPRMSSKIS